MSKHIDLVQYATAALGQYFELIPGNIGADAHLSKRGMTFDTKSCEIKGVGHLCVMRMNAFMGLMKMETIVIAPTKVDMPLFNVDWVSAFGTETLIAELYDTQLEPWPGEAQKKFEEIREEYLDVEDNESGEHWYDSVLYSVSIHKKGKGLTDRFNDAAKDYIDLFAAELAELSEPAAGKCPADLKRARVGDFARTLVENDGPAVNMMAKLFGEETMRRIVLKHMYGVE
jgi:hypothetical protein